jgi:hypothetical protein
VRPSEFADDDCVDENGDDSALLGWAVVIYSCSCVVIADRGVGRALSERNVGKRKAKGDKFRQHVKYVAAAWSIRVLVDVVGDADLQDGWTESRMLMPSALASSRDAARLLDESQENACDRPKSREICGWNVG